MGVTTGRRSSTYSRTCYFYDREADIRNKRVTIKDLARHLGLTPMALSKALRGHTDISAATRQRVVKLAAELPAVVALPAVHPGVEQSGRSAPVFNEKHLSTGWNEAKWI